MNWIQRQLKKVDNFLIGEIAVNNNSQSELVELRHSNEIAAAQLRDCKTLAREHIFHIDKLSKDYRDMEEIAQLKADELVDLRAKYIQMESKYNKTVGAMGCERTAAGMEINGLRMEAVEKDQEIESLKADAGKAATIIAEMSNKSTRLASDVEWERAYNALEKRWVYADSRCEKLSEEIVKLSDELSSCNSTINASRLDADFAKELSRPVDLVTKSATI